MRPRLAAPASLEQAVRESITSDVAHVFTKVEPPFRITHVNPAWVNLCGFSEQEAIGQTCRILQGPETDVEALRALHAAVAILIVDGTRGISSERRAYSSTSVRLSPTGCTLSLKRAYLAVGRGDVLNLAAA